MLLKKKRQLGWGCRRLRTVYISRGSIFGTFILERSALSGRGSHMRDG